MLQQAFRVVSYVGLALLFPYIQQQLLADECPTAKNLSLRLEEQKTVTWCWATTAKIVMRYKGEDVEQCNIVDAVRQNKRNISSPLTCCVTDPEQISNCMITEASEVALKEFSFRFESRDEERFDWYELRTQICGNRPVIYGEDYWDDGGHEYILKGFRQAADGKKWVIIYDPLDDPINNYTEKSYDDWLRMPITGEDPDRRSVEYYVNIRR
ncbi:MAG: hypothetical protein HOO98_07165 [Nitrospira sp.]|nr:hypothetical protein [Nitrospira sp.]